MSELDRVRQRITDRKASLPKNLELVKGPVLDMEAGLLKAVAETITPLLQAAKSEIVNNEGFAVGEQVNFSFMYDTFDSGFDHIVGSDEDAVHHEVWRQFEKKLVKSESGEDESGSGYVNKWVTEEGLPEKLVEGALNDIGWINRNTRLFFVRFALYNNEQNCHLHINIYMPEGPTKDPSAWDVTLEGPNSSGVDYPKRKYNNKNIDLLAEDLVDLLDNKNYIKKKADQP